MIELHSNIECLNTLIGLSRNECECISIGRPETYGESLSGLYMDDYEHGLLWKFPKSAKDCGDNNVWEVLQKARVEGINDFITHLLMAIGKNKNTFVDGFSGDFGEVNKRQNNSIDRSCKKDIVGFRFEPNVYLGASLKIKKIWLGINVAADYDVLIHDTADLTTPLHTVTIEHTGESKMIGVVPDDPIILPLSEAGQKVSYSFSYARGTGFPLDITYHCGCGHAKLHQWMPGKSNFFSLDGGFCIDDITSLQPNTSCCNRKYTGGLIIEWEMVCDPAAWVCQQDSSFWVSTQWGRVAAKAAQLICTIKSISAVLNSGEVNFYTQMMADDLAERRMKFTELSMELIDYLGNTTPPQSQACFRCKDEHGFKKISNII